MTRRYTLSFDYLCPFARNACEHALAALEGGADHEVEFLAYSLSQGHVEAGQPDVWDLDDPAAAPGVLALQASLAVRETRPERFHDVHGAMFAARHDEGRDIKDPAVVRDVLERADVDPDLVFELVEDGMALKLLRDDHTRAVQEHRIWGVPTFVTDTRAVFVRLMDRPGGDTGLAQRRIDHVLDLVDEPVQLHEFKQVDLPV